MHHCVLRIWSLIISLAVIYQCVALVHVHPYIEGGAACVSHNMQKTLILKDRDNHPASDVARRVAYIRECSMQPVRKMDSGKKSNPPKQ
jgi:hypothetical protein